MEKFPKPIQKLIHQLKKFPSVGGKSAERLAFSLLEWSEGQVQHLAESIATLHRSLGKCPTCFALTENEGCPYCLDEKRDRSQLCIVGYPKEIYTLEETRSYRGLYHVLGGLLSPLEGKTPEHLNLPALKERFANGAIQEVILALDSTIEGDATALFLQDYLEKSGAKITRLAFGLPMGSSFDYIDESTLSRALQGRQLIH